MNLQDFNKKYNEVKKPENLVPRTFQTAGGRWTVETHKSGDWTAQLQDEGATKVLINHATRKQYICGYDDTIKEKALTWREKMNE